MFSSLQRITVAKQRIKNLHQRPRCGLQRVNNPTSITKHTRYIPPMIGRVRIRVMESYNVSDETQVQSYPLSNSQVLYFVCIISTFKKLLFGDFF